MDQQRSPAAATTERGLLHNPVNWDAFHTKVEAHLVGPNRDRAVRDVQRYLKTFSGRLFEQLVDTDPFVITANDLIAVTALSVTVPPEAAATILGTHRNEISALLSQVPAHATIIEPSDLLEHGQAAWTLYDLLSGMQGLGPTTVSKLLAAKRPALIPIRDSVVSAALGDPEQWWQPWTSYMSAEGSGERVDQVRSLANDAGAQQLSLLRVLDVVIWMHHQHPEPADDGK